jgi:hypothetical protein
MIMNCDLEKIWMELSWGLSEGTVDKQTSLSSTADNQITHTRRLQARSLPHHLQRALLCLACYREAYTNLTPRDNNTGTAPDVFRSADIS